MAYKCPRCNQPVQRGYSSNAQVTAGLVGALLYAAFGDFQGAKCGKIASNEFPPEVRTKMTMMSLILVVCAIAVAIGALYLLAQMK